MCRFGSDVTDDLRHFVQAECHVVTIRANVEGCCHASRFDNFRDDGMYVRIQAVMDFLIDGCEFNMV